MKALLKECIENWTRAALFGLGVTLIGCSGGHDHHDHDHEEHGHAHEAPHGGALTMLGDHALQLELVVDQDAGQLKLYVLDGGAENFMRVSPLEIEARANAGDREWSVLFEAVANEATGETKGNTSHFVAEVKDLANESEFDISFNRLEFLGQVFEEVNTSYPEGSH